MKTLSILSLVTFVHLVNSAPPSPSENGVSIAPNAVESVFDTVEVNLIGFSGKAGGTVPCRTTRDDVAISLEYANKAPKDVNQTQYHPMSSHSSNVKEFIVFGQLLGPYVGVDGPVHAFVDITNYATAYEKRIGFVFDRKALQRLDADGILIWSSGAPAHTFRCRAFRNGDLLENLTLYITIQEMEALKPDYVAPTVSVLNTTTVQVYQGQWIHLSCKWDFGGESLMGSCSWNVPSTIAPEHRPKITYPNPHRMIIEAELNAIALDKTFEGDYTCKCTTTFGNKAVKLDTYFINVTDYKFSILYTQPTSSILQATVDEDVQLAVVLPEVEGNSTISWEHETFDHSTGSSHREAVRSNGGRVKTETVVRIDDGLVEHLLRLSKLAIHDAGNYTATVRSAVTNDVLVQSFQLTVSPADLAGVIAGASVGAGCLVVVLLAVIIRQRLKFKSKCNELQRLYVQLHDSAKRRSEASSKIDQSLPIHQQAEYLAYDLRYEVAKEKLEVDMGKLLGQGNFGNVFSGKLKHELHEKLPVAVKVPKNGLDIDHQIALLDELKTMIYIGKHVNVLGLIGAVTKQMAKGELFVIVELCEFGALNEFLRKHRKNFDNEIVNNLSDTSHGADYYMIPNSQKSSTVAVNENHETIYVNQLATEPKNDALDSAGISLATSDLLSFGYQSASGMEYLASRNLIHRDVAARNILLTKDFIIKISDFGLARKEETYRNQKSNNPLPWKWLAPESLLSKEFSLKSDIWSFGVALWEIFTLGMTPFPGAEFDAQFVQNLSNGKRMEAPMFCPNEIYALMLKCWSNEATARPDFTECKRIIGSQLRKCNAFLYHLLLEALGLNANSALACVPSNGNIRPDRDNRAGTNPAHYLEYLELHHHHKSQDSIPTVSRVISHGLPVMSRNTARKEISVASDVVAATPWTSGLAKIC